MRSNLTNILSQPTAVTGPAMITFSGPADPALAHKLGDVLHSLYVIAGILAVLLILSLLLAVWVFRRNRDTEPKA